MVNVKPPPNPVHKRVPSEWPPSDGREYTVKDDDDWWKIAAREKIADPWVLILYNFDTTVAEEVNWYLRELVGCWNTKDKWNYTFYKADKSKGKIYLPPSPTPPPPPKPVRVPWPDKLKKLEYEVQHSSDPNKARFLCMLDAMKNKRDDRVIFWSDIAPGPAIPAPLGVTYNPLRSLADDQWLFENFKTWEDVAKIYPYGTGDGSHPERFVLSLHKVLFETGDGSLFALQFANEQIVATHDMLDRWANQSMGGSSSMPRAYRAIKDFVMLGERSAGSVVNCITTTGKGS